MEYDAIIIGGGPAGYSTAIRLGQHHKKALMIEANKIGGECLNYGCIPSKAIIELADSLDYLKNLPGVSIDFSIDMKKWVEWKWDMINRLTSGVEKLCKSYGTDIVMGYGKIVNENSVTVNGETFNAKNLVIATGSSPVIIKGAESAYYNREILDIDHIPSTLLVVGGGYIGIELGTAFAKLGSKVTIIEMMPNILPGTDVELSRYVERKLKQLGVEIITGVSLEKMEKGKNYKARLSNQQEIEAEVALVTVGRKPNTQGFGLENLNLEMDGKFIKTDRRKRTSKENIYALGDVSGQPMLAHKAFYEASIVADNIAGINSVVDYRAIPFVIYSDPEISVVGEKTERYANFPLAANGRALGLNASQGVYRMYVDEMGVVKGGAFAAPRSSELISEITLAIEAGLSAEDVGLTIHPHPTLSEGVQEVAEAINGKSLHFKSSR
jgi:dihydrolipoamide dehydrogenase (EC 1.8.1.4)